MQKKNEEGKCPDALPGAAIGQHPFWELDLGFEKGGGGAHTQRRTAHNHTQNKDIRKMERGGGYAAFIPPDPTLLFCFKLY